MDEALSVLLSILLVVFLTFGLDQKPARRTRSGLLMTWPAGFRIAFGVCGWGPLLALLAAPLFPWNRDPRVLAGAAFGVVTIFGPSLWLWCEARGRRVLLTKAALVVMVRRRRRKIRWEAVSKVSHQPLTGRYIVSSGARRATVPDALHGPADFARAVLERVPRSAIKCEPRLRRAIERDSS